MVVVLPSHFSGRPLHWPTTPTESPMRHLMCGGLQSYSHLSLENFRAAPLASRLFILFVSLPVFIKLVKFLLQCCQACIILCSSHHCALQLPGNCVWRRRVEAKSTFWITMFWICNKGYTQSLEWTWIHIKIKFFVFFLNQSHHSITSFIHLVINSITC